MDKNTEMNLRLTIAVKAMESGFADGMSIDKMKEIFEWVVAPTKNAIIPATNIVVSQ